jgi:hypothetical protein
MRDKNHTPAEAPGALTDRAYRVRANEAAEIPDGINQSDAGLGISTTQ